MQERYERLVALQEEISWQQNRAMEGRVVEVLVSTGEGRKDGATRRMSGRARDGRLVHFAPGDLLIRPGDVVEVAIGYGAPAPPGGRRPGPVPPPHARGRRPRVRHSPRSAPTGSRPAGLRRAACPARGGRARLRSECVTDEGDERRCPTSSRPSTPSCAARSGAPNTASTPGRPRSSSSVAMLVLIGSLMLPWTGSVRGWEVLAGLAPLGLLPPLFAGTSLAFGLVCSALALATRWFGLAWLAAVGCGFSVVTGVWAIWSRQVAVPAGATGPGVGLVLAVLAVLVLAVTWVRIATAADHPPSHATSFTQ